MSDPAFKKAVLDVEKKKDLTTNHFSIGGPSANIIQTTQKLVFRPSSALERREARPMIN